MRLHKIISSNWYNCTTAQLCLLPTFDGYDLDSSRLSYTIEDLVNNKLEIVNNEIQLKSKYVEDLEYKRLQRLIEFVKSGKSLYSGSVENLMNLIKNSVKESDDMSKEDALSKLRYKPF